MVFDVSDSQAIPVVTQRLESDLGLHTQYLGLIHKLHVWDWKVEWKLNP